MAEDATVLTPTIFRSPFDSAEPTLLLIVGLFGDWVSAFACNQKTGSPPQFRWQGTSSAFPFTIVCVQHRTIYSLDQLSSSEPRFAPKRRTFLLPKIWQAPQTASDKRSLQRQFTSYLFVWAVEAALIKLSEQLCAFPAFILPQLMWLYYWDGLLY